MSRAQAVLLACVALITSASGGGSSHPLRARYDKPREAQEFFARKRAPVGERAIPVERYLAAKRQIEGMAHYSTRERRFLAWPTVSEAGEGPSEQALAEAQAGAEFTGPWTSLGPGNVGGRTRALLIDPVSTNTLYAAGVAGGVWKTTNAGASWTPLDDMMGNLAVSSLAMDPGDNDTIYAGTGEGYFNIDAVRGAGIFKTTNSGSSWTQLAFTNNNSNFHYVNDIVVSPLDSQRIYAATRTGVWRSTNTGTTFSLVLNGAPVNGCTDLAIRTDQATDVVFAACGTFTTATVYRNTDAGGIGAWQAVLSETDMARTSLAIAPSDQDTIYALASSNAPGPGNDYLDGLHAVFRSTTGGGSGTWTAQVRNTDPTLLNTLLLTNPPFAADCFGGGAQFFNQGWYDNVIAVDPLDPNIVWAGGIEIFRSNDGGQNWGLASHWWASPSSSRYSHADRHALVFHPNFNGGSNQDMFLATDGGIFRTTNSRGATTTAVCNVNAGSVNWTERNNNYGVTQFYYGAPYPDGNTYFGGTQDNGTIRGDDASGAEAWQQLQGGDGGAVAVDPANTSVLYAEFTGLSIQKSTDGGNNFSPATNGISDSGFLFIAPFIMDSSDSQRLWTGGRFMWRTSNGAGNWAQASAALGGGGSVSAIAVAPSNPNFVLAGQDDGDIHRTSIGLSAGASTTWAAVRPRTGYVSSLAFDPANENVAYATYSTFGGTHVWKSTNAGANWSPLDGSGAGQLPDLPCHSIAVDTGNSTRLYLGTDLGVFVSVDGGLNWAVENTGFANVITESLVVNAGELFAFTHGRGAYRVTLDPVTPPDITIDDVNVIEGTGGSVNATFTVSLSHGVGQTVTVQYATADGTATAPADYTSSSGTLTFSPGQTSRTVAVPVISDAVEESNETFLLNLSNASNANILDGQGVATIIDDDLPGTIVLSSATYTVAESGGALTVTVNRDGNKGGVTVDYTTSNGTATAGSDYTATSGTLTFGVGVTSLTFVVPIAGDTLDESDETFTVALSNPTGGATLGSPSSATVTITDDDTAGTLAFSLASYTASETGSKATISVTRSGGAASGVTVQYTTSDGSAQAGSDYTATSGTLTFGAKVSKLSFTVSITNDSAIEGSETLLLELSSPGGGAFLGAQNTAVLTITDNDLGGAFRFSSAAYKVGEASSSVKVTISRTGGTAPGVTVDFTTSDGTAQAPGDYTDSSGTLSFASGQTSQAVTIPIVTDALDEANETVNLTLSNPTGGATLGAPSASTLTITDNDTGGVLQFSLSAVSVDEGIGTASVVVSRTKGSADGVTVTCTPTDGSATSGQDHNGTAQVLNFGAGVMSQNCTIPIVEDGLAEGSETLNLTLSNVTGGATLGARQTAVLTITDNEPVTTLHFAGLLFAASEGGKATVTVKRSGPAASPVTVDYATSDGTGQAGSDYTTSTGTLSFATNVTSRTFTVQTTADTVDELDEDVNLTLANPTGGAVLGTQSAATLTITDNDAGGALQFSAVNYNKPENSPSATITVTRTGGTASAVTVDYATSDGTAQAPGDYTASAGTLTFLAGKKSATFTVGLQEDALDEANETVNLALSNPTGGATLGSPANATLTITDNDAGGVLQFSLTSVSVGEAIGTASVVVSRTGGSAGAVEVTCTPTDGSATHGADYSGSAQVLSFPAGVTSQNCTVAILEDGLAEGSETLNLTLSNPTGGASLGTKQTAVLTITDNEAATTLHFSGALFAASEGAKGTVTVKRSGDATSAVTVDYATSDGTGQAGSDYTASAGILSFGVNVTSRTFTVQTTADTLDEADEDLNLTLSNPTGGAALGTQSTAKLLITDNDAGGAFRLAKAAYSVSEKSSNLKVTVSRTGGKASGVTVDFATSDGTAQAPGDYTTTTGTLTFAANQVSQSVTIPIVPDTLDESNETLGFALTNPTGGATLGSPADSTVTITDNDTAGSVRLSAASYSVSESGGALTITVIRSGGTSGDVTVDYATSDGTAQAGTDYQTASGTLTFGLGETSKTFPVNINPDGLAEANETVLVTLSNVGGGGTLGSPSTATLYIVDDE